ncbi:hypothetical protein L6452_39884 [Arctium lappa]|uniref:Uncharacterized protein n=1 Tax=Arctium lappa TaxID=4217 RepID=A0ACB8XTS1_ARCLA|nr:hypothetical protein L6452_39884 [Arctium lappa]
MANGAAIKAWLVVASIGAVEALKDQGVARWNGPLKALHQRAKTNILASLNKSVADRSTRSLIVASESASRKCRSKKTKAESMKKVMDMNCFGPILSSRTPDSISFFFCASVLKPSPPSAGPVRSRVEVNDGEEAKEEM